MKLTTQAKTEGHIPRSGLAPGRVGVLSTGTIKWFALALGVVLLAGGWFSLRVIEGVTKDNRRASLSLSLSLTMQTIQLWAKEKTEAAEALIGVPQVREKILSLLATTEGKTPTEAELERNPDVRWLQKYLGEVCRKYSFIGFVLLNRDGLQVATYLPNLLGRKDLMSRSDFFTRAMATGQPVISLPVKSEIPVIDAAGNLRPDAPVMFVAVPIQDFTGKRVGVLAFRMLAKNEIQPILSRNRFDRTGETYIFDKNGLMLSESRFDADLRRIGLLPTDENQGSALNLLIRDPGGSMPDGYKPALAREKQPFTTAIESAIRRQSGVNVDGYNDYRGVPTVGAWTWLEDLGFGIVTEIDSDETYANMHVLKTACLALFAFLTLVAYSALVLRRKELQALEARDWAWEKKVEHENRTAAIYEHAIDGIITIDERGIVESWNPAAQRIFGWSAEEIVGQPINRIVAEPDRSRHDEYLRRYMETGEARIIGIGREVTGEHKDGRTISIDLAISEIGVGAKRLFLGITRNISDRKKAEEALRENVALAQNIVEHSFEALVVMDSDGRIARWNPCAEKLFGWTHREAVGRLLGNLIVPPELREQHHAGLERYLKTGETSILNTLTESRGLHKSGRIFPVELLVSTVPWQGDSLFIGAIRDISARKIWENEILRAKDEAISANQAKSTFLSMMSHELRTPMNAILGFAQLLEMNMQTDEDSTRRIWTGEIVKAGNHLLGLINEVLDLARIESGNFKLSLEPVAVNAMVQDVIGLIQPLADRRNIRIVDKISGKQEASVRADFIRIKQVLLNLLSNAIKYNHDGGAVTLEYSITETGQFRLTVEDTGPGIALENQVAIFQPFNRGDADQTSVEGTGIGLSICKRLVELMGGDIGFTSTVGQGSRFYFDLPLAEEASKTAVETEGANPPAGKKMFADNAKEIVPTHSWTVLYVEDNPANLDLVQQVLKQRPGIRLLTAPQAKLGLELARAHRPDLILMDINLPEMNGITALQLLRQYPETRAIPVAALSANAMQSDVRRGLSAGFIRYITKPLDIPQFLQTMDELLPPTGPR
jgi:protein-histidine pros-kinase